MRPDAEQVIGGIILGPTVCGRIPGFTQHVFPDASRPYLSLTANIGLVLFLFLVGLEIDGSVGSMDPDRVCSLPEQVVRRNARLSLTIACGGMILPFGLGSALAPALYQRFVDPTTVFSHFLLFVGVCFAITAFPVLCRILTELKLLDTTVGVVVLSAGVGNDIVGCALYKHLTNSALMRRSKLDPSRARRSSCQCELGPHRAMDSAYCCRMDAHTAFHCTPRASLACSPHGLVRKRPEPTLHDVHHTAYVRIRLLHRHNR